MAWALAQDPSVSEASTVTAELEVDPRTGLHDAEVKQRLHEHGRNELRGTPPEPAWRTLLRQFQAPMVYLLLVAVAISLVAWVLEGATGVPIDAVVIALIVIANAVIGYVQEAKAADAVAALSSMTEAHSTVLRNGQQVAIPSAELVPGDILVLSEGDAVGADARLLSATALRVQESALTGESEASEKSATRLAEPQPLGDRANMVFNGTAVAQGVGRAVVTATGMNTEMGAIADMLDSTESDASPLTREINQVSRMLGIVVIAIALIVMVAVALVNHPTSANEYVQILLLGVSLAVAAVPEGLPAILSLVLAIGVQAMARRQAVVKELHSVETLGSASVICTDKTGTLTQNEMTIQTIVTPSGAVTLSGIGYAPEGETTVTRGDPDVVLDEARKVLVGGMLANNAQLSQDESGEWAIQGDPTEAAFLVAAHKLGGTTEAASAFERRAEVPFTSERKMMSTLHRAGDRTLVLSKGGPDVLLARCTRVQVGDQEVPLDDTLRARLTAQVEELSAQAYRTLGVASRPAGGPEDDPFDEEDEADLVYRGVVGIIDPPRTEAADAIAEAHRAGIDVKMITGDHPITAGRIASDLGIAGQDAHVLTGEDLNALPANRFDDAVRDTHVFARVAPEHKLRIVDSLQDRGKVVAMTGDGVNDAPALKSADIGVAMGITGTEVTKEASRMILGDDNFATIVAAVRQGRVIFDNIRKFLRYLLSSNMGEVLTVFLGVVLAGIIGLGTEDGHVALPLLATQILWINLVTDSGPALAMGIDPETDDVMARRPRDSSRRIINRQMWGGIIFIGVVMAAVALATLDMFLAGGLFEVGPIPSDPDAALTQARTAGFTTLVFAQLFNALNARSATTSAFHRLFANPWLWGAMAFAALAQVAVVHVPFLQAAFGTTALDPLHWGIAIAMASIVLWADEIRKIIARLVRR